MTEPIATVACRTCGAVAWRGGTLSAADTEVRGLPFTDGQTVLTDYADRACPRGGGTECPNSTVGRQAGRDDQPVTARELRKVSDLLAVVDARTRPRT